ncbi:MAG: hypothetical protein R3B93_19825 [Bacteroidia bacterium]
MTTSYNKKGDEDDINEYMEELITNHLSGRMKVAPEHTSDDTLHIMRKPSFRAFPRV